VPFDSTQAAATANVGHWTASPGTLGNRVGDIHIQRVAVPVAVPTSWATLTDNADTEMIPKIDEYGLMGATKLLTLRGASEQLAISFNNAVVGVGQTHTFEVVWTEE
jgi:hypothetical protein